MAGKWEGFTEDDLKNLNHSKSTLSGSKPSNSSSPVNKNLSNQNRYTKKNVTRERMLQGSKHYSTSKSLSQIPKEARLFIPQIPEEEEQETVECNVPNKKSESKHVELKGQLNINVENNVSNVGKTALNKVTNENKTADKVSDIEETPGSECEPRTHPPTLRNDTILYTNSTDVQALEEFEERQKIIKEQNRLRKEFLKKAIEDRTKKTHAEARRLHQIEGELKKLDDQLITDVAILRDQIETASLEFMEAQKRFDLSEREYLDAKFTLFNKKERKELLTSHLCTIIEHNELRKAKKLSELMEKLEIGSLSSNFLVTQLPKSEEALENSQTVNNSNHETATEVIPTKDEKCDTEK